jgi:predicted naringenin-chalcone synthase
VKKHLQLKEHQMEHSQNVLREYGNMSSATLPHIWKEMLEDDRVPSGTPIITLAFGPGLTICGAVLEKCGGSP